MILPSRTVVGSGSSLHGPQPPLVPPPTHVRMPDLPPTKHSPTVPTRHAALASPAVAITANMPITNAIHIALICSHPFVSSEGERDRRGSRPRSIHAIRHSHPRDGRSTAPRVTRYNRGA